MEKPERSAQNYFKLMGEGLKVVFQDKMMLLFVGGICIEAISLVIWGEMILFPLYYGYTGSDGGASILRFTIWITGVPLAGVAAKLSSKMNYNWLPHLLLLFSIIFYGSFMLLITWGWFSFLTFLHFLSGLRLPPLKYHGTPVHHNV